MSFQVLSIIGLALIVLIATVRSVNMGAIAFLGAFLLGIFVFDVSETICSPASPVTCSWCWSG